MAHDSRQRKARSESGYAKIEDNYTFGNAFKARKQHEKKVNRRAKKDLCRRLMMEENA